MEFQVGLAAVLRNGVGGARQQGRANGMAKRANMRAVERLF